MYEQETQTDLKEYWAIIWRRKTLLILPMVIIPLVALVISYVLPATYSSTVSILLSEAKILPPNVERQLEGGPSYDRVSIRDKEKSLNDEITSTKYLKRLIAVLDIPIPQDIREIAVRMKAQYPEISENELAETILADRLRQRTTVDLQSNNLIEIGFSASNPVDAQKTAKALADIFIEESLAKELAGVRSNIAFSEEQLALYREKLTAAEDRLKDFRKELLVSAAEEDTSGQNLRQIASAIEALELEISLQESKLRDIRGRLIADGLDISSIRLPQELVTQKDQLLTTIATLTDLLTRHTWKDPRVLSLNEEAKTLLGRMNDRISNYATEEYSDQPQPIQSAISEFLVSQLNIEFNRAKKSTLDRSLVKIKNRLSSNPDTEVTMKRLQSEIDNYRNLYDLFVSHAQYAAINQSAKKVEAEAKYLITKPASLPLAPESPNRKKMLVIGFILALALGVGALLVVEVLDDSFKNVDDLEEKLEVKVLGTIPRMDLPFGSNFKKKIPVLVGAFVSFLLVVLIVFLRLKESGG
jgi:succinoglycan biosynthesis transport protein ExoP